ncbi:MAG: TPR end-of-group domain-containing protein [Planctomycetota bacterium]|jgi:thiol-disulfide isomerase/thioredoxin
MKRYTHQVITAIVLAFMFAGVVQGQEDPMQDPRATALVESFSEAIELLQEGNHDSAIEIYEQALENLEAYDWMPEDVRYELRQLAHYNVACGYSLKKDRKPALEHFEQALKFGFDDLQHITDDTDLDNIRNAPRFKELIAAHFSDDGTPKVNPETPRVDPLAAKKRKMVEELSEEALFDFDFSLETVDGKQVALKDLRGKVVLVDVWGTWCPPCRKTIPHLVELQKKHGDAGLQIVGLNFERIRDQDEARDKVLAYRKENGIEYPCALTPRALIDTIPDFRGFPTMLMVDREGRVRLKHVGYTEGEVLEAAVLELLAEDAPASAPATPKSTPRPGEPTLF